MQKTTRKREPAAGTLRCDEKSDPGLGFASQSLEISELLLEPLGRVVLISTPGTTQFPPVSCGEEHVRGHAEGDRDRAFVACARPGDVMPGTPRWWGRGWPPTGLCPLARALDPQMAHASASATALQKDRPGATGQRGADPRLKSEKKAGSQPFAKLSAGTARTPVWPECRLC